MSHEVINPADSCIEEIPPRLTATEIVARVISQPVNMAEMRQLALKSEVELRGEGNFVGADAMVCAAIVAAYHARNPHINIDTQRPQH